MHLRVPQISHREVVDLMGEEQGAVYPNRPCGQGIGGVDSAAVPCPFRLVLSGAAGRLTVSDQELEPVEKGCRSAPLPLTKAPFDLGEVHARVLDPSQDPTTSPK